MKAIRDRLRQGAGRGMSEREMIMAEITRWKNSKERRAMLDGARYYRGEHDILRRKRVGIGANGQPEPLPYLPNHRVVDNQYAQMVDQKVNYLLGRPFLLEAGDEETAAALEKALYGFRHTLHRLGEEALKGGLSWLYPYIGGDGALRFRVLPAYEVLPFWADAAHTVLDMAVRVYEQDWYDGKELRFLEQAEVYKPEGVFLYTIEKGELVPKHRHRREYVCFTGKDGREAGYGWGKLPLIPFRYNAAELPLICKVKSLQDGINEMLSDFENHMQEDARNTILILKNYDGANLAEFRHNLSAYGVVKVKTVDGAPGGVESLRVDVGSEHYKVILELLRRALCRNAMGYDARDERMTGAPNQMNIQSMYSDIDLDASGMETEFQMAFDALLWFVKRYLAAIGQGAFTDAPARFVLNRDMAMNEGEIMDTLYKGGLRMSNKSLLAQVPWVNDVEAELQRLREEGGDGV